MSIIDKILAFIRRGLDLVASLWRSITSLFRSQASDPASLPATAPAVEDNDRSDLNALARMLSSEDRDIGIKTVIGWITIKKAKSARKSLFEYITSGKGYGPQDRRDKGQGIVYAATTNRASDSDRVLAERLLSGSVRPPDAITRHKPGGWVERIPKIITDERIIEKQKDWNEGIYARIAKSKWVLYSPDSPKVYPAPQQSATDFLDSLPVIELEEPERMVA